MAHLLNGRVNKNAVKDIKFETMMIVPSVLLQKPPKSSEAKYHLKALERALWKRGNLSRLLHKAATIQKSLKITSSLQEIRETSTKFASLTCEENLNAVVKHMTNNIQNVILLINKYTFDFLKGKTSKR